MNPEFRQTLNTFSHNFESANQAAQENIYTFTQLYVDPCLSGLTSCLQDCTAPCFPSREDSLRRRRGRGRSRGRAENFFDFYDDWDDEEDANTSALAWGNDELDSLLAESQSPTQQPRRPRAMSYGSRGRRVGQNIPSDSESDPTIIPGSSYLGFLERFPFKIGTRVLRYKPSAANLQENPGALRMADAETQHLLEEDDGEIFRTRGHGRQRSDTQASRSTTNSLSSRGDLIMSDEEEDAVALDDEFAITLGRRSTNVPSEDHSSGKTGSSGRRQGPSRGSSKSSKTQRSSSRKSLVSPMSPAVEQVEAPTMKELRQEEEQARKEEEMEIEQKREAAQKLAAAKGLSSTDTKSATAEVKPDPADEETETPSMTELSSPRPMSPEPMQEIRGAGVDVPLPSIDVSQNQSQDEHDAGENRDEVAD